jgi:hypothetical protein
MLTPFRDASRGGFLLPPKNCLTVKRRTVAQKKGAIRLQAALNNERSANKKTASESWRF